MVKKSLILLNLLNLIPRKINDIISHFKNTEQIFRANTTEFRKISSLSNQDIEKILELRNSYTLDRELRLIEKDKIECLDIFDKDYPLLLKEISNPPLVLYIKGDKRVLNKFLFAIVGTRTPTVYGISMAQEISYKLSLLGMVIVSGLAKGIDTAAHQGAIKKGESVAILGSGLFNIYPKENKKLAESIGQSGAVVSEFPLFTPPLKENFPRRNRIISGLSKGVLVVEAGVRSGARVTARLACEQNREVFALPGKADSPLSKGTHILIKEGAKLVDSLEDILEEFNIEAPVQC